MVLIAKSQGDFERLLVVRIDQDFQFRDKLSDRGALRGIAGKYLKGRFEDDDRSA